MKNQGQVSRTIAIPTKKEALAKVVRHRLVLVPAG